MEFHVIREGHPWPECPGPILMDSGTLLWIAECLTVWNKAGPLDRLNFHKAVCRNVTDASTKATMRHMVEELRALGVPD